MNPVAVKKKRQRHHVGGSILHALDCVYLTTAAVCMLQAMGSYIPDWLRRIVGHTDIYSRNLLIDSAEVFAKIWNHTNWSSSDLTYVFAPENWAIFCFLSYSFYLLATIPFMFRRHDNSRATPLSPVSLVLIFVLAGAMSADYGILYAFFYVILNMVLLMRSIGFMLYGVKQINSMQVLGCGQHSARAPVKNDHSSAQPALEPALGLSEAPVQDSEVISLKPKQTVGN